MSSGFFTAEDVHSHEVRNSKYIVLYLFSLFMDQNVLGIAGRKKNKARLG